MDTQIQTVVVRRDSAQRFFTEHAGFHSLYEAALRLALKRAPVNYGLKKAHNGSTGWRFVFVKAR